MKNIFKILLPAVVVGVVLLLTSFRSAPVDEPYIFVRVFESNSLGVDSEITVTDGNTVIKSVEIKTAFGPKNRRENSLKIATTLSEIKKMGYTLLTSSSAGPDAFITTDYVFEKK